MPAEKGEARRSARWLLFLRPGGGDRRLGRSTGSRIILWQRLPGGPTEAPIDAPPVASCCLSPRLQWRGPRRLLTGFPWAPQTAQPPNCELAHPDSDWIKRSWPFYHTRRGSCQP